MAAKDYNFRRRPAIGDRTASPASPSLAPDFGSQEGNFGAESPTSALPDGLLRTISNRFWEKIFSHAGGLEPNGAAAPTGNGSL